MTSFIRSYAKYFVKMRIVAPLRAAFVSLFAPRPNRDGWERRMLIVNLEALGDMVMFTGVLKHYRERFPEMRIVLAMKARTGLEPFLYPAFVDEVVPVNYRRFAADPFYGYSVIASLRRMGFRAVVNQDFSASEVAGKFITISLGAETVIGSDGLAVEHEHPFDIQQVKNQHIVERLILPRYTAVVQTRSVKPTGDRLPNAITYYAAIFEQLAGGPADEYAPTLASPDSADAVVAKFGLTGRPYAVMNVSASVTYRRWPTERFVEAAQELITRNITPVVIGAPSDRGPAAAFAEQVPSCVNLAGKTSLPELIALIAKCTLVFTNDSSTVHLAVALKRPSLCITGGGQFGMQNDYGYADMNMWAYTHTDCYGDNFRCGDRTPAGEPSPCIAAVSSPQVMAKLAALADHCAKTSGHCPCEPFRIGFDVR